MRFAAGFLYHFMRFFATPVMFLLVIGKWMFTFGAFAFGLVFLAGLSGHRISNFIIATVYALCALFCYFCRVWYWDIVEKAHWRSRR
jgi:hypothetical protein